jgi:adhesin/invasin
VKFEVTLTGPGVVTNPRSDHAVAQNWPGGTLNSPEAGANPGEYCTLYLTGQGALDRAVPTGAAAPADPLALPLAPVQIWVGDQAADVTFAGLAPGFVGVLQVNILIPDVAAGEQPLRVTIGGVSANPAVLSIR